MTRFPDAAAPPRATILVPVRDGEPLLRRAIDSARVQSERSIEILVIDDGSSDGTWNLVEAAAADDPRVRGIRLPRNIGAPAASNVGISAARGQWIAVLDHDDWYDPVRLERLIGFAEQQGHDLVADNQHHWDERAGAAFRTAMPCRNGGREGRPLPLRLLLENAQTGRPAFDYGMLKPVVRADFLRHAGVRYREGCPEGYDFHFLLDVLAAGASGGLLHEPLYWYVTPFGELSREHCRPDKLRRKLANYGRMREHAECAAAEYAGRLPLAEIGLLRARARSILAYSAWLEARAGLAERRWSAAAVGLAAAPAAWPFAARAFGRALARLALSRVRAAAYGRGAN